MFLVIVLLFLVHAIILMTLAESLPFFVCMAMDSLRFCIDTKRFLRYNNKVIGKRERGAYCV